MSVRIQHCCNYLVFYRYSEEKSEICTVFTGNFLQYSSWSLVRILTGYETAFIIFHYLVKKPLMALLDDYVQNLPIIFVDFVLKICFQLLRRFCP